MICPLQCSVCCWERTWSNVKVLGGSSDFGLRTCKQQSTNFSCSTYTPVVGSCNIIACTGTCCRPPASCNLIASATCQALTLLLTATWPWRASMSTMRSLPSCFSFSLSGLHLTTTCRFTGIIVAKSMSREPAQPSHHLLLQTLAFTDSVFFDILHQQPEYGLLKDQVALG